MRTRLWLALAALLALIPAAAVATRGHSPDPPARPVLATNSEPGLPTPAGAGFTDGLRSELERRWYATVVWNAELDRQAQAAEAARQEQARRASTRPAVSSRTPAGHSTGEPSRPSGHSDAWWHGVSICEQGGRNDPYFGYFSIMDGSAGGLPWATQVAMANRIIARYGDGAWAASCVAAGYRASPGG